MKPFLISIFLFSIISWAIFAYFIFLIPPKIDGQIILANIIYTIISGFLGLLFTTTSIAYFIGNFFQPKVRTVVAINPSRKLLFRSLRRGFLFSASLAGIITLNVFEIVNLLNAGLIIGIAVLAEIYSSSR